MAKLSSDSIDGTTIVPKAVIIISPDTIVRNYLKKNEFIVPVQAAALLKTTKYLATNQLDKMVSTDTLTVEKQLVRIDSDVKARSMKVYRLNI